MGKTQDQGWQMLIKMYGSQKKLAEHLGVTEVTVTNFKKDRTKILKHLPELKDQTGLSISTLYELIMNKN